jgi:hypothetical protein
MARILGAFPSALIAARGGMSANSWIKEMSSLGMAGRRSEMLQLYKTALGIVSRTADEPFRPLNQAPTADQMGTWPTKNKTGIAQTVTLTYRDKATGTIKQTWYRTVNPTAITRERAVAEAINSYSDSADRYGQELIGAVHTSAYNLSPFVSIE